MKKFMIMIISLMFVNNLYAATSYKSVEDVTGTDRTKLKAPLLNLFKTTDWGMFLEEFEINLKVGTCGSGRDLALGFKAHMIEPLGYMENTKKPLHFPFADLDLGGNILKSCTSRAAGKEESARDECHHMHFIYAPIMGMIFKKKLTFVCFHEGTIALPLITEFDPIHLIDVYNYKTMPHMIAMFTPQALVGTILNCAATVAYSAITGYSTNNQGTDTSTGTTNNFDADSWASGYEEPDIRNTNYSSYSSLKTKGIEALTFIRNSMYYNVGCLGFSPVGGYINGGDPGTDTVLLAYESMAKLHGFGALSTISLLEKQTEFGMESNINGISTASTMCRSKDFALPIETQYVFQRAYPTVAGGKEQGEPGITTTTAANVPGSKDSFVNVFWQRRDYYAFAYYCKTGDMSGQ